MVNHLPLDTTMGDIYRGDWGVFIPKSAGGAWFKDDEDGERKAYHVADRGDGEPTFEYIHSIARKKDSQRQNEWLRLRARNIYSLNPALNNHSRIDGSWMGIDYTRDDYQSGGTYRRFSIYVMARGQCKNWNEFFQGAQWNSQGPNRVGGYPDSIGRLQGFGLYKEAGTGYQWFTNFYNGQRHGLSIAVQWTNDGPRFRDMAIFYKGERTDLFKDVLEYIEKIPGYRDFPVLWM